MTNAPKYPLIIFVLVALNERYGTQKCKYDYFGHTRVPGTFSRRNWHNFHDISSTGMEPKHTNLIFEYPEPVANITHNE